MNKYLIAYKYTSYYNHDPWEDDVIHYDIITMDKITPNSLTLVKEKVQEVLGYSFVHPRDITIVAFSKFDE